MIETVLAQYQEHYRLFYLPLYSIPSGVATSCTVHRQSFPQNCVQFIMCMNKCAKLNRFLMNRQQQQLCASVKLVVNTITPSPPTATAISTIIVYGISFVDHFLICCHCLYGAAFVCVCQSCTHCR